MISDNKYQIWITYDGEKEKIRLPVLPEQFTVSMGTKDKSVDIVGLGEILIAQNRPATEFSFSSFLPSATFPGIQFPQIFDPKDTRDKLTKWKSSMKPVHLIVTGFGIDCYCRITKFKPSEKGGDVGTIYYDISLKEYREITIRQITIKDEKATIPKNNTTRTDNRETTFKIGDIVIFSGGYHYKTSIDNNPTGNQKTAGKAIIQNIALSSKHKYALIGGHWRNDVPGNSDVYGWVDESTVS